MLRKAEEAAEAIVDNAVEVAEQTRAEAHERTAAELAAARRDVESAHREAAAARAEADAAAATRAAAEDEVRHVHEVAARGIRQLADEIASRRQEVERATRVLEERLSRLAWDIDPAEPTSPPPHVTVLASGSAAPSAHEPAVERMVEFVIVIVLAITFVAAMLVLVFVVP